MNILKSIFAFLLVLSMTTTEAQDKSVSFAIKNAGFTVNGFFGSYTSQISYDEANPSATKFNGEIDVKSINTDNNMRDNHLRKEDYFDVAKFPKIKFSSTTVTKVSDGKLKVVGNLTIKDVTKAITFEVVVKKSGAKNIFSATIPINRRTYNVGGRSLMLSDDLKINLNISK